MCRTSTPLILFVLTIVSLSAHADLIHHWKLDENTATGDTIAIDSVGGLNGTIQGARSVPGKTGNALSFDGSDDLVTIQNFTPPLQGTVVFWINPALGKSKERIFGAGGNYEVWLRSNGEVKNELFDNGSATTGTGAGALKANQWNHVTATYDSTTTAVEIYLDGELKVAGKAEVPSTPTETTLLFGHRTGASGSERYGGLLDDIQIYDEVLKADQVRWLYNNPGKVIAKQFTASKPSPADGATDIPRDVVLSWTPGIYAPPVSGHKVYLSESFNNVKDGIGGITADANSYAPSQRLDFGTTYYWRVDEVNGPPDYTVYKGDVWSFTTEPVAYPIAGTSITATSSSRSIANRGPEKTIDGSGLDDNDLHSTNEADMWLSSLIDAQPWIQYEFDRVYKLQQMWVWNYNMVAEPIVGLGFKDVTIKYSINGTKWTAFGSTHQFARAPGRPGYAHNTTVNLSGVLAKYVKITLATFLGNWGGILPQYGLSEVRFFYVPVVAREPNPASGSTGVAVDNVTLSWRAGREADKHNVYLSTDQQAVIDGTAYVETVRKTSYGPLSLDLSTTYYWKISEVNMAETPTTWEGNLWSFTTRQFLVVDDFESYNDLDTTDPQSNRIFNAWIDGYGTMTNGSIVGYENPPFAEKTIVHGGRQSMPLLYSNTAGKTYSEAERTFAIGQDWTKAGSHTLVLFFQGTAGNTGQLYVKVNGSKVVYSGDAGDIAKVQWKQWNIDLASLGVNLQNVTKLGIGIDGNGASGKLYFDDIRLYRLAP